MTLLDNLKWRYATKKYDSSKKVRKEDLQIIKESVQLAATSYGLQLFKVIEVTDPAIRAKLQPACWGQPQTVEASNLFIFANYADVHDEHIEEYMQLKADTQGIELEKLSGYGEFVKGKMNETSHKQKQSWTARQTYIALANAMAACAELKIDSTPIEGFEAVEVEGILGLQEKGLKAAVMLAIGYRSEEDATQFAAKVRKPIDAIFETI